MRRKRILALLAAVCLLLSAGCASQKAGKKTATQMFTDSCGRKVELPAELDRIIPSGPLAQIVLYTVCPDKLISLSTALTRVQKRYIDKKYWDLPVTGQLYGGGGTMNLEEIMASNPDVIIDVGEKKEDIRDDMDALQDQSGVPVIFIQASLDTMADAYDTLGRLTGETEQASACAGYIRGTLSDARRLSAQIPEEQRKRVLYAQGEYGTEVLGEGSLHAEVLDYVGAKNVAVLPSTASQGGNEVSMEQILLWNPDVVILSPEANYDEIFDDPTWANVSAVQNGEVYEAPMGPWNWMDRPPSVQRVLAIKWLGNLLYPKLFDYDMIAETQKFYRIFWHDTLSETEARALMAHSTCR
jgi:iron complex transport system substrate-binding protein